MSGMRGGRLRPVSHVAIQWCASRDPPIDLRATSVQCRSMRIQVGRGLWIALVLPVLAVAASSAQQERAAVVTSKPDEVHGAELFGQCIACHGADGGGEVNG